MLSVLCNIDNNQDELIIQYMYNILQSVIARGTDIYRMIHSDIN